MSQIKSQAMYSVAGLQDQPGARMSVRSHVYVPGGDASADRPCAQSAARPVRGKRRRATVPLRFAAVVLGAAVFAFGMAIVTRMETKTGIAKNMHDMETRTALVQKDNTELAVRVSEARDSARICYAAARNLGMVAAEGTDIVYLLAPVTRPQTMTASLSAEASPLQDSGVLAAQLGR